VDFLIRELGAEWLIFSEVDVIDSRAGLTIPTDADLILAHPHRGFCFVECKSGRIRRSGGVWEQLATATGEWHFIDPMKQALRAQRAFLSWFRNSIEHSQRSETKFIPSIAVSVFSGCARPPGNSGPVVDGSVIWADEIRSIPNLLIDQLPRVSQPVFSSNALLDALFGDVAPTEWDLSDDPGKVLLGLSTIEQEIEQLRQSLEDRNHGTSIAADDVLGRISQLESVLRNDEGERRLAEIDTVLRQIQLSLNGSDDRVEIDRTQGKNKSVIAGAIGALVVLLPFAALLFAVAQEDSSADEVQAVMASAMPSGDTFTVRTSTSSTLIRVVEEPAITIGTRATSTSNENSKSRLSASETTAIKPVVVNQAGETISGLGSQPTSPRFSNAPNQPSRAKKVVKTTVVEDSSASSSSPANRGEPTTTLISSNIAANPTKPGPSVYRASELALGAEFSCAIDRDSSLGSCWGSNSQGYLGDGSQLSRSFASPVSGDTKYRSLVAGSFHVCGITQAGTTLCWGMEQTGRSSGSSTLAPTEITGGHLFTSLFVTRSSTCGITPNWNAWCWGDDARPVDFRSWRGSAEAIEFDPSLQISEFSGGGTGGCFRELAGVVQCWAIRDNYVSPWPIPLDHSFEPRTLSGYSGEAPGLAKSAGSHSCGKSVDQSWICWGSNGYGQLGSYGGESDCLNYPGCIRANTLSSKTVLKSISSGSGFSCGIDVEGTAICWGRNDYGQLGRGYVTKRLSVESLERDAAPTPVKTQLKFSAIGAGFGHVCGISLGNQEVWCWGNNSAGQLGNLSRTDSDVPVQVVTK
jgi:hypothetical protein